MAKTAPKSPRVAASPPVSAIKPAKLRGLKAIPPAAPDARIISETQYAALQKAGFEPAQIRNHALRALGHVLIITATDGRLVAVVKYADPADQDVINQAAKLLATYAPARTEH